MVEHMGHTCFSRAAVGASRRPGRGRCRTSASTSTHRRYSSAWARFVPAGVIAWSRGRGCLAAALRVNPREPLSVRSGAAHTVAWDTTRRPQMRHAVLTDPDSL